jgi:hypothetical protein
MIILKINFIIIFQYYQYFFNINLFSILKKWNEIFVPFRDPLHSIPFCLVPFRFVLLHQYKHCQGKTFDVGIWKGYLLRWMRLRNLYDDAGYLEGLLTKMGASRSGHDLV